MLLPTALITAALSASVVAAANTFSLYAFGGPSIQGLAVFYADGYAYTGYTAPSNATSATNVTFTLENDSLYATPNTTTNLNITWTTNKELYIIPSSSAMSQVGFVDENSTAPTGAATSKFLFYGRQLQYADSSSGAISAQFWATPVEQGLWKLIWNGPGMKLNGSFPLQLKTTPPLKSSSR